MIAVVDVLAFIVTEVEVDKRPYCLHDVDVCPLHGRRLEGCRLCKDRPITSRYYGIAVAENIFGAKYSNIATAQVNGI